MSVNIAMMCGRMHSANPAGLWQIEASRMYSINSIKPVFPWENIKPKIIVPAIVKSASYAYDTVGFYSNDKTTIIPTTDKYLLGLIGSKALDYYMHTISSTKQGGYFEYKPMYISKLPIRTINFDDPTDVARHEQMVSLVDNMLELNKRLAESKVPQTTEMLRRQIESTDRQIDQLVYRLYDLTEEEIKILESET